VVSDEDVYKVELSNQQCSIIDSVELFFITAPQVDLIDTSFCEGGELNYSIEPDGFDVAWSFVGDSMVISSDTAINISTSGNYVVTLVNESCVRSDNFQVSVNEIPVFQLEDSAIYCPTSGDDLELSSGLNDDGLNFLWSTGDENPTIVVANEGIYSLTVTDMIGCSFTDSIEVVELCETEIYIPDGFTPNDDGLNDDLQIFGQYILGFRMLVYNQWGAMIFESSNIDERWNGSVNGRVTTGTYTLVVDYGGLFADGEGTKRITKDITVIK